VRILVIGSGGREHALCWTLAASPLCDALFCAPGNAGIARDATCVPIQAMDIEGILDFVAKEAIDFVVVGPEDPLVAGLVDRLTEAGVKAFGPSAAAARLEGSKGYMKDVCRRYGIPTADYRRFTDRDEARAYVEEKGAPIVVKTDGLAAGKGVTVALTVKEALQAIDDAMTGGKFGAAGEELVIEEFMEGEELSYFALCDGKTVLPFASAQDHKAAYDGDAGPNTGGMGAYSPAPVCTPEVEERILKEILEPTMKAMEAEGAPYKGVLFLGLMITKDGPRLIEFNVRFGDPECQVLMMRLMSDLAPALIASADGVLSAFDLRWYDEAAVAVVMASQGYPGSYEKGTAIQGVDEATIGDEDVLVFHAGTVRGEDGVLRANGGRVLNVTARGQSVSEARTRAYGVVDRIEWPTGFCRRDIGWRAVQRERG
jgi:phosphoribosylamine--glycine ligase